jgi:hypothetical protein
MKRFSMTVAVLATLIGAGSAMATEPVTGGVKIFGTVNNHVEADRNSNYAYGSDARAFQSIGTLHSGTEVYGTLNNTVYADENQNYADGDNALACQSIGSIGEFEGCKEKKYEQKLEK